MGLRRRVGKVAEGSLSVRRWPEGQRAGNLADKLHLRRSVSLLGSSVAGSFGAVFSTVRGACSGRNLSASVRRDRVAAVL